MEDFDAALDLDVGGDVDEEAVGEMGFVKGGPLGRAEAGVLLHEVLADEVAVGDQGLGQRQAEDAGGELGFGVEELVVGEDEFGGGGFEGGGALDDGCGQAARALLVEGGEIELLERREAPHFMPALRGRQVEEALPGRALAVGEPGGKRGGRLRGGIEKGSGMFEHGGHGSHFGGGFCK